MRASINMAVRSPSYDRTWPFAEGGVEERGLCRMHGKYSFGLSLEGRVIDIIIRRTRMPRRRRRRRRPRPLVRVRVAVIVVLSPFLPHLSRILYIQHTRYMYNASDLTNFFIYRLCWKISLPPPSPILPVSRVFRPCALPPCYLHHTP